MGQLVVVVVFHYCNTGGDVIILWDRRSKSSLDSVEISEEVGETLFTAENTGFS